MPPPLRRISLMLTAACFALSALAGCAAMGKKPTRPDLTPWPEIRSDFRLEPLRQRIHEYSITFAAEVDLAATSIEQRATDSTVRRNAMLWRVRAIPEMRKAGFRLEPIAALIDTWIFARQMDQLFSDGGGAGAFGTFQPEAVQVSRRLVEQMREIGGSIAVSPEARVEFERKYIDPWLAEHPLRDITFVRESPIARFADQSRASGDMVQSVGTMEELAVSLSQQARIYLGDLPRQVRGEVDLMRSDIVASRRFGGDAGRPAPERCSSGSHRFNRRRHVAPRPERAANRPRGNQQAASAGDGGRFRRAGTGHRLAGPLVCSGTN